MPVYPLIIHGPPGSRGSRTPSRSRSRSRSPQSSESGMSSREASPPPGLPSPRRPGPRRQRKKPMLAPQAAIDEFWTKFMTKNPGKATTVIPPSQIVTKLGSPVVRTPRAELDDQDEAKPPAPPAASLASYAVPVHASYEAAAAVCRAKVAKIVRECRRVNKKYRDAHFDIEADLKMGARDCLESLQNEKKSRSPPGRSLRPRGAKRVTDIFDDPKFYIDGPSSNDVRQGRDGDCWLLSALCTLSNKEGMIERLCVAHDQDVGVYGFVFHRDGEWISEIVDDFLYLTKSDYDEGFIDRVLFDELERTNPEELYRKVYQSNSGALYFAQCAHPHETWLPLLEKCYAKAHGDFAAIEGGFGGEGIEDLTGGITSEIFTSDILDKEVFWKELLSANKEFLFSCATGIWGAKWGERTGIYEQHSYSVQRAVEIDGKRLVRLKNPWGKGEWKGPWSDGSKEWTPEWLQKLDHRFGDDGDFWIEYKDLLRKYQSFERTRLFEGVWSVAHAWTTLNVPWMVAYHDVYFSFTVSKPGRVVIVLTQLDDRYFRGLEGQYTFLLSFRVHKAGREDYVVRSQLHQRLRRSVSVELDLEAGEYDIRIKIDSFRDHDLLPIEEVVRKNAKDNRDKLTRIGLAYDLAHSKGQLVETAEERAAKAAHEKKIAERDKKKIIEDIKTKKEEAYFMKKSGFERQRGRELKRREKREARTEKYPERKPRSREPRAQGPNGDMIRASHGTDDPLEEIQDRPPLEPSPNIPPPVPDVPTTVMPIRAAGEGTLVQVPEEPADPELTPVESEGPPDIRVEPPVAEKASEDVDGRTECESRIEDDLESLDSMSVYSGREMDIRATAVLENINSRAKQQPPGAPDPEPDEFESDPWNAVAVVGLRVYHQCAEGESQVDKDVISLRVVRPDPYADDGDGETPQVARLESKTSGLDVDDSAKDATLVGEVKDRQKSIMGNNRKPNAAPPVPAN